MSVNASGSKYQFTNWFAILKNFMVEEMASPAGGTLPKLSLYG